MKVIITRARKNGTFDDVGMMFRMSTSVKTEKQARVIAHDFSKGDPYRIEFFGSERIYGIPMKTVYHYGKY